MSGVGKHNDTSPSFWQTCPVCGRPLRVSVQLLGETVVCGHCRGRFVAADDADQSDACEDSVARSLVEIDGFRHRDDSTTYQLHYSCANPTARACERNYSAHSNQILAVLTTFFTREKQMKKTLLAVATLLVAGAASLALADDVKQKTETKNEKKSESVGEKPKSSPGWVVIEEDWWIPFLDDFSTALRNARDRYGVKKEEKAASAEIDKAIAWLKYAESHANKATAEDLATARADLTDFSTALKGGKPVLAKKLDTAFAHASAALAKHHHFKSEKAIAQEDLKAAGRHLMAAADHLRAAAQFANLEYGRDVVNVHNQIAPSGSEDDKILLEKEKVESNLTTIKSELEKLATKLKASK